MAIAGFLESYVFGPSGFWAMAPLRCAAKFDPFLSLDCAPTPSTLATMRGVVLEWCFANIIVASPLPLTDFRGSGSAILGHGNKEDAIRD